MGTFNRFDICEAWYLYVAEHGSSGQWSASYAWGCAVQARLTRLSFRPGLQLTYGSLTPNGQAIYDALVERKAGEA